MSLENTPNENFFTPTPTNGRYSNGDDDTVDTSTETTDEEEKDDLGNATEFHEYMKEKKHVFKTCKNKLLWYDPKEGVYQEESSDGVLKLKLFNLFSKSTVLEPKYRGAVSKHNALYSMLKTIVDSEQDFYEKSQVNTKGFLAFKNCIWDFNKRVPVPFDPKFYFTFKSRVDYEKHDPTFEKEVFEKVCESIFGKGEKSEFFMKLLARALAGEVKDKRFIVLLGETNSGKGTLTQLLGDCFGLGNFVGNYTGKDLQGESATLDWLMLNKNCRIILANEINAEKPILLNNIKYCANGGEPITGKLLYKNKENFIPQGTMFLNCNEMPQIKGNDAGDAVLNRMVYVGTEYKYLKPQEYEKEKADTKVRLANPSLKDDYLKKQDVQEAFARLICKAYESEAPPLPECCINKALEYKPEKSLKERLEKVFDFTGDKNDYVVFVDLYEHFQGVETSTAVGNTLTKMGIRGTIKKVGGKARSVRLGIKLKDFENTTQEYESDTSPEVSFADVDTVMTSPIKKGKDEELVTELRAENAELKEALKAKEQVPEGCDKALKTCLETKSETVKTATMKKAVEGLLLKIAQLEETRDEYRQRFADYERLPPSYQNQQEMSKTEPELLDYELYELQDDKKELVALVRYFERGLGKGFLNADGKVLPEMLEEAKATAPVDTFDTE